jgi:hypothetical protein
MLIIVKKGENKKKKTIFVIDQTDKRYDEAINYFNEICQNYGIPEFIIYT